jgi:hypothetical protein
MGRTGNSDTGQWSRQLLHTLTVTGGRLHLMILFNVIEENLLSVNFSVTAVSLQLHIDVQIWDIRI